MTPRRSLTPLIAAAALAMITALAGCTTGGFAGGPDGGTASTGSASPSSSASASASSKPSAAAAFTIPTTCIPAVEVSALLGLPEAGPTMTADEGMLICEYLTATQNGAIINYQRKPGLSAALLAQSVQSNTPAGATVAPIDHLGDAAYELNAAGSEGVIVLQGDILVTIAGGNTSLGKVEALALDAIS